MRRFLAKAGPLLALGLLSLIGLASPQHYRNDWHSANEASRLYAAMAIVDHQTLSLDPVFDHYFKGWRARRRPPNMDVAYKDGRYLTDKAPGITLLAVPLLAGIRVLGIPLDYAQLAWLFAALFAALPTFLFLLAMRRWCTLTWGPDPPARWVAPALVLASPWLLYCAQLFGHALAASLVGLGLLASLGPWAADGETSRMRRQAVLGGLALGGAVVVEFPAAVVVLVVLGALAADPRRRHRLPWVVFGGLGPAVILATWNSLAFGGPLAFSYGFKAHPALAATHAQGVYGIGWPSFEALWGLLASASRGLLFSAPWLAAAGVGAAWLVRDRGLALAWRVTIPLGLVASLLFISGFADWHGGRGLGPRYLLFSLPLWGLALAWLVQRLRAWPHSPYLVAALGGLLFSSTLLALVGHLVFPHVDHRVVNPLFEVLIPIAAEGARSPTIWDALLPLPTGTFFAVVGVVALGAALVWPGRSRDRHGERMDEADDQVDHETDDQAPGAHRRSRLLIWVLAVTVAILHLVVGTLPISRGKHGERRVIHERALAHEILAPDETAPEAKRR